MWSWLSLAALAQHPSTPVEPLIVAAEPWPVRVTAYLLPPHDPAWLTDESPVRSCTVQVTLAAGAEPEVTPKACADPMPEAMVAATRHWTFEPVEGEPEGRTTLEVRYVVRYEALLQVMTVHAEVNPGHEGALSGRQGPPEVKLVHPAHLQKSQAAKVPGSARKAGTATDRCVLRLTIDGRGKVARSESVDCPEALHAAATKAASRWRYAPRIVDGRTMPETVNVDVAFK